MDEVAKHPRLMRRNRGVYYFRPKVPADLLDVPPYGEVEQSLRTRDPREALALVRQRSAQIDLAFEAARRRRDAKPTTEVPDSALDCIARHVFHDTCVMQTEWFDANPRFDPVATPVANSSI